jgi:HPt (histidine-containing phosphotransfer) domain-containing protein
MTINPKVIDLDRINDAADGDTDFLRELVAVYLDDASAKLRELNQAIERRDSIQLGRMAHQLKGSSANMGAIGVSKIAKELETLGRANNVAGAKDLVRGLEAELALVVSELTQLTAA